MSETQAERGGSQFLGPRRVRLATSSAELVSFLSYWWHGLVLGSHTRQTLRTRNNFNTMNEHDAATDTTAVRIVDGCYTRSQHDTPLRYYFGGQTVHLPREHARELVVLGIAEPVV